MRKEIYFKEGEFHHNDYIDGVIEETFCEYDDRNDFLVQCHVDMVTRRRDHKMPLFECEMIVYPRHQAPIVVHKEDKNFYFLIKDVCKTAERNLLKKSAIKAKKRQRLFERAMNALALPKEGEAV